VEAFKASLEEVVRADLLVHVVDISHPEADEQILAVNAVLEEIGAGGKPVLMVLNKVDKPGAAELALRFHERYPNSVAVSARTGDGMTALFAELGAQLRPSREFVELRVPHENAAIIAKLHAVGQVVERDYDGPQAKFKVRLPPHLHAEFAPFIVRALQTQ
jgi:GTP-binding protein HflX